MKGFFGKILGSHLAILDMCHYLMLVYIDGSTLVPWFLWFEQSCNLESMQPSLTLGLHFDVACPHFVIHTWLSTWNLTPTSVLLSFQQARISRNLWSWQYLGLFWLFWTTVSTFVLHEKCHLKIRRSMLAAGSVFLRWYGPGGTTRYMLGHVRGKHTNCPFGRARPVSMLGTGKDELPIVSQL